MHNLARYVVRRLAHHLVDRLGQPRGPISGLAGRKGLITQLRRDGFDRLLVPRYTSRRESPCARPPPGAPPLPRPDD